MSTTINKILVGLFIIGAVIEGVRHGATLTLLQHSLFASGLLLEQESRLGEVNQWTVRRIIGAFFIVAAAVLLYYNMFTT